MSEREGRLGIVSAYVEFMRVCRLRQLLSFPCSAFGSWPARLVAGKKHSGVKPGGALSQGPHSGCDPFGLNQNSFADSSPCLMPCTQSALGFKLGVVSSGNSLDYTDKCLELMSSNQVCFQMTLGWGGGRGGRGLPRLQVATP